MIANKLQNFALLRANLKLKMVINGNSFYYGKINASYLPLQDSDEYTPSGAAVLDQALILETQRPRLLLDATTSTGGEMILPFFFPNNWFSIPANEWRGMGRITMRSFQPLAHANGATQPITISIFAYAENVNMCLPTSFIAVADEYSENGVISKPASTVAKVAGMLTSIPAIAPYARATEMAATMTARIARIFGYSRPVILNNIAPYIPFYAGLNAPTDADDPVAKLTTDSKQELTIDPRTVGLSSIDELSINHLATKETYLTQFRWLPGTAEDAFLFNCQVTPRLYDTNASTIYMTSMGLTSLPFRFWRGSIRYRFQIVRPTFYKGRMRISWDPAGPVNLSEYNTSYSKIVDITEDDDITVTVGWGSKRPYLRMEGLTDNVQNLFTDDVPLGPSEIDTETTNGIISVSVVNELSSAAATTSPISVNVFVSAHEDLQYARPTEEAMGQVSYHQAVSSSFTAVSAAIDDKVDAVGIEGETSEFTPGSETMGMDVEKVFFGEKDLSFRTLMKRYQLYTAFKQEAIDATNLNFWIVRDSVFPRLRGFAPNAPTTTGAGTAYNYTTTGIMSLLLPCYVGVRGSVRCNDALAGITFNKSGLAQVRAIAGEYETADIPKVNQVVLVTGSASQPGPLSAQDTLAGTFITPTSQQPMLRYENPYYNNRRFSHSRTFSYGNATEFAAQVNANTTSGVVELVRYIAAGEDFNLFFYCGPPPMYLYPDPV